jgi:hypothetical protein
MMAGVQSAISGMVEAAMELPPSRPRQEFAGAGTAKARASYAGPSGEHLRSKSLIRCGSFKSVKELTKKIDEIVTRYNEDCKPFTWTATADSILEKLGAGEWAN